MVQLNYSIRADITESGLSNTPHMYDISLRVRDGEQLARGIGHDLKTIVDHIAEQMKTSIEVNRD